MEQDHYYGADVAITHRNTKNTQEVTLQDVVTQDAERDLVENLLTCSFEPEESFNYVSKIVCNDWNQAVHGWEDTRPYVKYAWGEVPAPSKKRDAEDGGSKRSKAQRHHQQQQQQNADDSWKRCVEPKTYRYIYDPKGLHRTTLKYYNGVTLERAIEEDGFTDHILKLREYLEKTLTNAKKETSNGIREHAKLGQYYANKGHGRKVRKGKAATRQKLGGMLHGIGDGLYYRTDISSPEDEEDARLTFKGVEGRGIDEKLKSERQATPILPVRKDQLNNGQLIHQSDLRESPRLKLSHGLVVTSATNSYEKFPSQAVTPPTNPNLSLSPLKKVTPHQRRVHDDNEVLLQTHSIQPTVSKPSSAKSEPDHSSSYKVVLERSSAPHIGGRADRTLLDHITGHAVSTPPPSGQQFPLAHELAAVSKLLREQDLKNKNKAKRAQPQPRRLGAGDGRGKGKLADPLHRGVVDRETAEAIASELLPGVSGHKLHLPIYSQRIL